MDHKLLGEYNKVLLSPLSYLDIEKLRIIRNKNKRWFVYQKSISIEEQVEWYCGYLSRSDDVMFSVFHRDSQKWVGAVGLYHIDQIHKQAEFGRIVIDGASVNEKGLGLDATICVCNIGFEKLGLSKITLEVYNNNVSARKTYERAGFSTVSSDGKMLFMELNKDREKEEK